MAVESKETPEIRPLGACCGPTIYGYEDTGEFFGINPGGCSTFRFTIPPREVRKNDESNEG